MIRDKESDKDFRKKLQNPRRKEGYKIKLSFLPSIKQLYLEGKTSKEIGLIYGVDKSTIIDNLRRINVKIKVGRNDGRTLEERLFFKR